jgi:hypothetical protein
MQMPNFHKNVFSFTLTLSIQPLLDSASQIGYLPQSPIVHGLGFLLGSVPDDNYQFLKDSTQLEYQSQSFAV